MNVTIDFPDHVTGCTCGPYWSVVPPPPCPYHALRIGQGAFPHGPVTSPKELADAYRRLADALDPPVTVITTDNTR